MALLKERAFEVHFFSFLQLISHLTYSLFANFLPLIHSYPPLKQETSKPKLSLGENLFLFSLWCQIFGRDIQFYSIKTLFSCLKMFQGQFFSRLGNKNIRRVWSALNKYFVLFLASNIVSILSRTIKRLDKLWWFQFVLPMNE